MHLVVSLGWEMECGGGSIKSTDVGPSMTMCQLPAAERLVGLFWTWVKPGSGHQRDTADAVLRAPAEHCRCSTEGTSWTLQMLDVTFLFFEYEM